jgi:hypothetical protein
MDISETLNQRGKIHGPWSADSGLSQALKEARKKWTLNPVMPAFMREALDLIDTKQARIEVGDPFDIDHWSDISGYATLVVRELERAQTWVDAAEQAPPSKH